jgi:hypothetical protein
MNTFPILHTGAVTQYPAVTTVSQPVSIVRFLDGEDQRWLARGSQLRQWQVRLELLNDGELRQIEAFFAGQLGEYSLFSFVDPGSGVVVPNCRIAGPELATDYIDVDNGRTSFWIAETHG